MINCIKLLFQCSVSKVYVKNYKLFTRFISIIKIISNILIYVNEDILIDNIGPDVPPNIYNNGYLPQHLQWWLMQQMGINIPQYIQNFNGDIMSTNETLFFLTVFIGLGWGLTMLWKYLSEGCKDTEYNEDFDDDFDEGSTFF